MKKVFQIISILLTIIATWFLISCGPNPNLGTVVKVTYNYNFGDEPRVETRSYYAGESVNLPEPEYEGFYFLGWATTADSKDVVYKRNTAASFYADTTLYGIWIDRSVTFKITLTTGSLYGESLSKEAFVNASEEFELSDNPFKKDGYYFLGYSKKDSVKEIAYSGGEKIYLTEDITLYAIYVSEDDSHMRKIIYHSNDGTNQTNYQYCYVDSSSYNSIKYKLEKNNFIRDGYIFYGWAKTSDAEDAIYEDEKSISSFSFLNSNYSDYIDLNLYAVWVDASKLYVTYMRNYSNSDTESVTKVYEVTDNKASYNIIECPF